jgi:integrase
VLRGAKRAHGTREQGKAALEVSDLRLILKALPKTALGVRDRAILVFGFASGLRRSELAALDLAHVRFVSQGLRVSVGKGKTDQEGKGREIGIFPGKRAATCPVRVLRNWLLIRRRGPGPLFCRIGRRGEWHHGELERLSGAAIAETVKRGVMLADLDPDLYGGHSLRAGCVATAAQAGVPESIIMLRTGHRSIATLARYVRPATLFSVDPLARAL